MRIGKEYKPCEVKFGNGLKIGEAFYYRGEYDNKEELYMCSIHIRGSCARFVYR